MVRKAKGPSKKKKSAISIVKSDQLTFSDVAHWEIPPLMSNAVEIGVLPSPIWTETKAKLIANYLRLFLLITRHGAYIDGFAGPQDKNFPDSWAAKLVVEISPAWMKKFFLCEVNRNSYADLVSMLQAQPTIRGRQLHHKYGDFNQWVDDLLASGRITEKTATFALLDQRSTECHWATVKKLAAHKSGANAKKIELFYFFPTGWVHRTIKETEDKSILDAWWGDDGWREIERTKQDQAAGIFLQKFHALGYRDVKSWPICSRPLGAGKTMYHMIHATDHLDAPKLMYRAYKHLIGNTPAREQFQLPFDTEAQSV